MYVKNERWDGVPFIIKAGKALNEAKCEIRVQFKDVPGDLFESRRGQGKQARNEFVVRLQPDPTIFMKMTVKEPGLDMNLAQSELELLYTTRYQRVVIPEAYERLILDLSLIHISEPTRLLSISYAVFCLKKKTKNKSAEVDINLK